LKYLFLKEVVVVLVVAVAVVGAAAVYPFVPLGT
jgi:hypothetical protein